MAFVRRILEFKFQLAQGSFLESGTDTVTLRGLRATAKVIKAGTPSLGQAQLQIFGMKLSLMNQLATLGMVYQLIPRNVVTVSAGDEGSSLSVVFAGTITQAWADFQSAPDVPFNVQAHTLGAESVIAADPISFTGSADVAGIMSGLAGKMNCTFENNGVQAKLSNPYFYGSARSQADACASAAGIKWVADDTTLAIWPSGGARGGDIPLISPQSGMVGYPSFMAYGINVRTIFIPSIKFGAKIKVESSLKPACGTWAVVLLAHDLATLVPGGEWYSSIGAFNPNYPQPVLG